jgi:thioredoxin reductase (NADPH)
MIDKIYNVVIIGGGPAGLTAAIYTARANLEPVLYEGDIFDSEGAITPGGQLTTTTDVENFPGFTKINGSLLIDNIRNQAIENGAIIKTETIKKVEFNAIANIHKLYLSEDKFILTKTVIIATGAYAKKVTLENGEKFWNHGISACAVCDGALPIFRNKNIAVIGGGDSAMEEALYLSRYAKIVYIIHRRDKFNASKIMQDRVFNNEKIKILWDTIVTKANGNSKLESIDIENLHTNKIDILQVNGLFYAIGHSPNTQLFKNQLNLDESGYIITSDGVSTNINGVFAAGDVADRIYKQAITSAGTGCMAALEVERYLN